MDSFPGILNFQTQPAHLQRAADSPRSLISVASLRIASLAFMSNIGKPVRDGIMTSLASRDANI